MRIAMIDPSLFTLPYDAALAEALQQEGHDVILHGRAPGADDNDVTGVPLQHSFYRVSDASMLAPLPRVLRLAVKGVDHAWSMNALLNRLRRERPDVIHFQWLPLPIVDRRFLGALRRIAPLVLTVHDTNPFNGNPTGRLQRIGAHAAFSAFDRLIVHTGQGRARLLAHGESPSKVILMPHGLLGQARPVTTPDPMDGERVFVLFGKMKPYKGIDLLIEAFAMMPPELRAQSRLRIVGKPYMDLATLHRSAAELGIADRVQFEPRFVGDDEVKDLFAPGTIAAFPYREIEASGVLSLAITHGRPILATRLGGFIETVEDGTHGVLVPPEDARALSAAMAQLVSDRDFAIACAANVVALTDAVPTWRQIARSTVAIYDSIAPATLAA